ncbi:hypothetical protein TNCV_1575061 [Trichonephila clavipes]|nr:hypothetical protein TNCV_1575061 [Trichonephila clavipes]
MSSERQDSTKGLKNSPYLSCVRPRLSRARIFASSSSYSAGRSVLERPVVTNLCGTFPLIFLGVFLRNINSRLFPINSKKDEQDI